MAKTPDYIQEEIVRRFGPRSPCVSIGIQLRTKYFKRLQLIQRETHMSMNCLISFIICEYLDELAPKILLKSKELKLQDQQNDKPDTRNSESSDKSRTDSNHTNYPSAVHSSLERV